MRRIKKTHQRSATMVCDMPRDRCMIAVSHEVLHVVIDIDILRFIVILPEVDASTRMR